MAADLRAATAAVLERMCGRGGVLDQHSPAASHRLHADNPKRRRTLDRIIESYLAEQDNVVLGGADPHDRVALNASNTHCVDGRHPQLAVAGRLMITSLATDKQETARLRSPVAIAVPETVT